MDEEKKKEKKRKKIKTDDVSLGSSLASEGICLFVVDLWEAQPCLGDPE